MNRYLPIACTIIAALTLGGMLMLRTPDDAVPATRHAVTPPQPEETEENPASRELMELMQFRDPATGEIPRGIRRAELAFAKTLPKRDRQALAKRSGAAFDWTRRGPANVGGRTRAFAIDAANPNRLLAGGITGGMWFSEDGGLSWWPTTAPDQLPSVTCLAQDRRASKRNVWYYGTGEFRSNSSRFGNVYWPGNGIFKSIDGGISWGVLSSTTNTTPQQLDSPFEYVNDIVTDPSNPAEDEVYAACYGAIMRSTDGGANWRAVLGGAGNNVGYTSVAITTDGVVYAGFGSGGSVRGIWRSADGVTWHNISPIGWSDSCRRIVLAIAPSDQNILYVLAQTPHDGLQVPGSYGYPEHYSFWRYDYISGDGAGAGGTWDYRTMNLPQTGGNWTYNGLDSYTMNLVVDPADPSDLYLGGTNLYESIDGFATPGNSRWMGGYQQNGYWGYEGSLHPDQHRLVFAPNSESVYATTDGGMFRCDYPSADEPTWTSLNNGYYTTQFYSIAIDPATPGSDMMIGGLQDNGTVSTSINDGTAPWATPYGGDGCFCQIAGGGVTMYVSSQNGNIFRVRTDGPGGSPNEYVRIQPTDATGFLFLAPFALDRVGDSLFYLAAGNTLWRNSNTETIPYDSSFQTTSANWTALASTTSTHQISAVSTSLASPARRVYYGTVDGRVYRLDDAWTGMPAPRDITGASFPPGAYVNCIAVDPVDGNRALVVFTNYNVRSLFYTTDAGGTWTDIGGNLEEHIDGTGNGPSCRWATVVHRGSSITAFVGTTTGLYSTTSIDGPATTWELEGPSTIGYVRVDMIDARASDGYVAVGTWGKGAYSTTLPPAGVDDPAAARASRLLDAVAPNPVRTSATIGFTIPPGAARSRVRVTLFDVGGRQLATLVDDVLSEGRHTVAFDPRSLPGGPLADGSYYYRIECGAGTETRRLVVMR